MKHVTGPKCTVAALILAISTLMCIGQSQQLTTAVSPVQSNAPSSIAPKDAPLSPPSCFEAVSIKDIAAVISAIASVVNLVIVVVLFRSTSRNRNCERQEDFKLRETERQVRVAAFWIEELIMRPSNQLLHKFFDDYELRLKNSTHAGQATNHADIVRTAQQEVETFKSEYHTILHRVIEPLQWVHSDFAKLLPIFSQIEDLVTNELIKLQGIVRADNGQRSPADRLADLRRQFFQTIHSIQREAVLVNPKQ